MRLSQHFTLSEFTRSATAMDRGLDNTPDAQSLERIQALVKHVLEPARVFIGKPIQINSGYRSLYLNSLIGGAKNSQHMKGEAADIVCPNLNAPELAKAIIQSGVPIDQMVLEYGAWVHISLKKEGNRHEVLTALKENEKTVFKRGLM